MVVLKDAELAWEVVLQLLLFLPACVLGLSHYWRHGKVTAVFAWPLCSALSFNSSLTAEGMASLASVLGCLSANSAANTRWLNSLWFWHSTATPRIGASLILGWPSVLCAGVYHLSPGFVVSDGTMFLYPPSGFANSGLPCCFLHTSCIASSGSVD